MFRYTMSTSILLECLIYLDRQKNQRMKGTLMKTFAHGLQTHGQPRLIIAYLVLGPAQLVHFHNYQIQRQSRAWQNACRPNECPTKMSNKLQS